MIAAGLDTVACYAPIPGEPGGTPTPGPATLPEALARVCGRLLLPIVLPDLDLDWAAYSGSLRPGYRGLLEPDGPRLGTVAIRAASLIIVPALAVDRTGVRLGRGGGSYDRALSRVPPGTAVVAALYDGELVEALPHAPHDRRVTAVVMPSSGLVRLPVEPGTADHGV